MKEIRIFLPDDLSDKDALRYATEALNHPEESQQGFGEDCIVVELHQKKNKMFISIIEGYMIVKYGGPLYG